MLLLPYKRQLFNEQYHTSHATQTVHTTYFPKIAGLQICPIICKERMLLTFTSLLANQLLLQRLTWEASHGSSLRLVELVMKQVSLRKSLSFEKADPVLFPNVSKSSLLAWCVLLSVPTIWDLMILLALWTRMSLLDFLLFKQQLPVILKLYKTNRNNPSVSLKSLLLLQHSRLYKTPITSFFSLYLMGAI